MSTGQRDITGLSIDEAIKISKIICSVSEERIPIIIDVFSKAGINIGGLEELEEWKALKDQAYIVDMVEFVMALTENQPVTPDEMTAGKVVCFLRPQEFAEICKRFNVKPSCAKRALHRKGLIKTTEHGGKLDYTVPVWVDGKVERRIVILKEAVK